MAIAEQLQFLDAITPLLLALAAGKVVEHRKFFLEATKGFGKDLLICMAIAWLLLFSPIPLLIQVGADDFDQAAEFLKTARTLLYLNEWWSSRFDVQAGEVTNPDSGTVAEVLTRGRGSAHGSRPNLLVVNELSNISDEETAIAWTHNAAKALDCGQIFATNAGIIDSWQYKWREDCRT